MQVRLLGPVDFVVDGAPRPVPGLRRKAVLAVLALNIGEIVSADQLASAAWADCPPPTVLNSLQAHVSHLRKVLGSRTAIVARPPGYVLDPGGADTDVQFAEQLLRQGTQAADPVQEAQHLRAALALWRGRPLPELAGLPWLEEQARRLDLLWLQTKRALVQARLAAGEHAALLPDLEQLAAENPLDEPLWAQFMLALYRSGRQSDALAACRQLRDTLGEELGIGPSRMISDLQTAILRQDPALDPAEPGGLQLSTRPGTPVPAQLPPSLPAFAGRLAELAALDAMLPETDTAASAAAPAVVISAVSGMAGVGKTALAVHWSHRAAACFADGQLYVNLRGFDPGGQALEPGAAIRGFLEALGVPADRIPAELPAQAGLYRSLLAGKRVLVVLDNARDVEQVRPLLPGSPGSMALVTSRNSLTGLVAGQGAVPLTLDLLTVADARELLTCRLGADRVGREPDAVDDIIAGCARLPLALALAAARAAAQPSFPLAVLAAELRAATRTLDSFRSDDPSTDARAVFSWSYQSLSEDAARLYRLLGLHPGPDLAIAATASLAGLPPARAHALLAELTRAHLLTEHAPGRYAMHDLLRAHATELALAQDSPQARRDALGRLLGHCLHTAHTAATLLEPRLAPIIPVPCQSGVTLGETATAQDALSWFTAEHAALLALVPMAAEAGFGTHAWQLASSLTTFLLRLGRCDDQLLVQNAALAAADRSHDVGGQAHTLHGIALGYARSGRFGEAGPYFRDALRRFETVGDQVSQARVHSSLTWLAERAEQPADALEHALAALELYRAGGHAAMLPTALNDVGYCHALLGQYQQAIACCQRALAANQALGERSGESDCWDSLGYIHHQLGDHHEAIRCYERSLTLCRELADRYNEAGTLDHIGDAYCRLGNLIAARRAWQQAVRIFDELDHPDSEHARGKLRDHSGPPAWISITPASGSPTALRPCG
jgi:DNA-binding SARP family transcriptional activator